MKVKTGTNVERRSFEVELDGDDGVGHWGKDAWDGWTPEKKFKMLSALADRMVVAYLFREKLLSQDMAAARLRSLKEVLDDV